MYSANTKKLTILVVDDSPTMLRMMVNTLSRHYSCISASSGDECIAIAKEHSPTVILMDVVMPKKTGIETAHELGLDSGTKDIPVVLVTSTKIASDDFESGLESGAIDYIRRPFNDIELLARVRSAIRLKESFDNLKRQNEELHELNKMKTEFLAIASHDLRSPFTSILGLTEILTDLMPDNLTEDQESIIKTIHKSAERQLSYINDLLSLAMNQSGGMEVRKDESDFFSILEDAYTGLKTISDSKGITIHIAAKKGVHRIRVDKVKIIQVMNNLLTNAIKFSHEDSAITLNLKDISINSPDWEATIPEKLHEEASKQEKSLFVEIQDEGVGIPDAELPHLFQRFQLKNKRLGTKGESGTGLGLAICKSIVELHGGVIWGTQNPSGTGATFSFTIPYTS